MIFKQMLKKTAEDTEQMVLSKLSRVQHRLDQVESQANSVIQMSIRMKEKSALLVQEPIPPQMCQEVCAVMTDSDIVEEDAQEVRKDQNIENGIQKYGMIANNYFTYQPVTLNQIDEAKSGEESKLSEAKVQGISSFKDQMPGFNIQQKSQGMRKCSKCENAE